AIDLLHHDNIRTWPDRADEKAKAFLLYLARREHDELTRIGIPAARPAWLYPVAETIGTRYFGTAFSQSFRASQQLHQRKSANGSGAQPGARRSRPPPR